MKLNNLSKILAILRQACRGEINDDIRQEDIDIVRRELPEEEVDKKLRIEQVFRQKELDSLAKSNRETQLKKKIAEDSIKKIRQGEKSVDRKTRMEAAKESEKDIDSFDLEEEEAESPAEETVFEESAKGLEEELGDESEDFSPKESDGFSISEQEELESSSPSSEQEESPSSEQESEDYLLDSGEEALPSLEEMNIDEDALEKMDVWSKEVDQDGDNVENQASIVPEDQKMDENQDLEASLVGDDGDKNVESVEFQNVQENVADEKMSDEALEIDENLSFVTIEKLSDFNGEKASDAHQKIKDALINPLLNVITYRDELNVADDDLDEGEFDEENSFDLEDDDDDKNLLDEFQDDDLEVGDNDENQNFDSKSPKSIDDLLSLDDDDDEMDATAAANVDEFDDVTAAADDDEFSDVTDDGGENDAVATATNDDDIFAQQELDELEQIDEQGQLDEIGDNVDVEPEGEKVAQTQTVSKETIVDDVESSLKDDFSLPLPTSEEKQPAASQKIISSEEVDKILAELDEDESFFDELDENLNNPLQELANEQDFQESDYEKALAIINSYKLDNRNVVIGTLKSGKFSPDDADRVSEMVLEGKKEEEVVSFIQNQLYQKNYKENFKKDLEVREKEEETLKRYYKKERALSFFRIVVGVIFPLAATTFFILFYGIDMMHSEVLYRQSYSNLEDKRYERGEEKFDEAYKIFPSMRWSRRVADLYIDRGIFAPAEKKYLQALETNFRSESILNEYGEMLMIKGDYERSWLKYQEALEYHPDSIETKENLAQLHIEWGKKNEKQWAEGDKVLNELIFTNEDSKLFYYAKKLEIASLRKNYLFSNFYYDKIKSLDEEYVEKKAFRRYAKFLSDHYERINTAVREQELDPDLKDKNTRIFFTMKELKKKIFSEESEYLPFYHVTANWMRILGQDEKARRWVGKGINIFENGDHPVIYRERFSPTHFYNLQGKLFYQSKEIEEALNSFQKSINYKKEDAFANYYLGRIQLLQFNDIVSAEKKFNTAYFNWEQEKNDDYRDLVYSLGYVNYKQGLKEKDVEKQRRSLKLWHQLLEDEKVDDYYPLGFALSLAYLSLDRYELAEAFIDESIEDLTKYLDYYQKTNGLVPKKVLERVKMLSDNYNNLGVVQISKSLSLRDENSYVNKQKAIEHFIDSITLKEKLNLLRGVPHANFNRVNSFPQVSREFLLADISLRKTLLP